MCISSKSNLISPCKLYNNSIKDKDNTAECVICQFWNHMKCIKPNHIGYSYL